MARTRTRGWRWVGWPLLLGLLSGCPSSGSSSDAVADTGDAVVDLPVIDDLARSDAGDAGLDAAVPQCVPGLSIACACSDGRAGAQSCNERGRYDACVCATPDGGRADVPPRVLPPRLLTPQSVSRATTQRPTLRWVLPAGVTQARVTLARDRALTREVRTQTVAGASWRPTEPLAFGVWFWRVEGLGDDGGTVWTSATWEFRAPRRDTPVDSSWGTLRDFDGDGYDDVAFISGISGPDPTQDGLEFLLGGPSPSAMSRHLLVPRSEVDLREEYIRCGDINGDGLADLLVPVRLPVVMVPDASRPRLGEHALDVYYGGVGGLSRKRRDRVRLAGFVDGFEFARLASTGDVNGDGYGDVIAGSQRFGTAFAMMVPNLSIHVGASSGIETHPRRIIEPDESIHPARTVGDFDGDGYADIGVYHQNPNRIEVFQGDELILGNHRVLVTVGEEPPGVEYQGVGDVDGDGRTELAIASGWRVALFRGAADLMGTPIAWSLPEPDHGSGLSSDQGFGAVIAGPGDVDGDGYADLLIASPQAPISGFSTGWGWVYLYHGGATGPGIVTRLEPTSGSFGRSMSSGGDLNGDGYDDVLIASVEAIVLFGPNIRRDAPDVVRLGYVSFAAW